MKFIPSTGTAVFLLIGACSLQHVEPVCKSGELAGNILASPVDGAASIIMDGKSIPISSSVEDTSLILSAARSSRFKYFYVPLRVKSQCKLIEKDKKKYLEIRKIKEIYSISSKKTLDRLYDLHGVKPVRIR